MARYRWGMKWFWEHKGNYHPAWIFIRQGAIKDRYTGKDGILEWAKINCGVTSLLHNKEGDFVVGLRFESDEAMTAFLLNIPGSDA